MKGGVALALVNLKSSQLIVRLLTKSRYGVPLLVIASSRLKLLECI